MMDFCSGQLKLYSSVTETTVDWLWYPYIPFGKITLIQGDPGCGKSTLMMNLIASVSNGSFSIDRKTKENQCIRIISLPASLLAKISISASFACSCTSDKCSVALATLYSTTDKS